MVSPSSVISTSSPASAVATSAASVAGWQDFSPVAHGVVAPGSVQAVPLSVAHGTGTGMLGWVQALGLTLSNGSHLNLYFGLVSCLLLALVAGLLLNLSQQLKTLKEDLKKAPLVGAELTQQLTTARQALTALQQAVKETAPGVDKLLSDVAKSRQELIFLLSRAEKVAEQLVSAPGKAAPVKNAGAALAAYGQTPAQAPVTTAHSVPVGGDAVAAIVHANGSARRSVDLTVLPEPTPATPTGRGKHDPLEDLISSLHAAPAALIGGAEKMKNSMVAAATALEEKATSKISRRASAAALAREGKAEEAEAPAAKKRSPSQAELDLRAKMAGAKKVPVIALLVGLGLSAVVGTLQAEEKKKEAGATGDVTSTMPTTPTIALPHSQRGFSPAEADLLQDLQKRKVELDRREEALELREKLADLLEQRLGARTAALEQLKTQLEGMLHGLSGKDDAQLIQLSQMYAAMKPEVAASTMDRLDNAIVHDVLLKMPVKKSGKILEVMDPTKARAISEMMAQRSLLPALVVSSTNSVSKTAAK